MKLGLIKFRTRYAVIILSIAGCLFFLFTPHIGMPVSGRVVDAVSGKPVEGAIVVADWQLRFFIAFHPGYAGFAAVSETVSDHDGNYRLPGWGPKFISGAVKPVIKAPEIWVFKSGYLPFSARNSIGSNTSLISFWRLLLFSEHDGETLALIPLTDGLEGALLHYRSLDRRIESYFEQMFPNGRCLWTQTPQMLKELGQLNQQYANIGKIVNFSKASNFVNHADCEGAKEILESAAQN